MSLFHSGRRGSLSRLTGHDWGRRSALARRESPGELPVGWLIAGVAAVGLGVLVWTYLGPDLKRYLKIHSM